MNTVERDFEQRRRARIAEDAHRLRLLFHELEDDLTRDPRPPLPGAPRMVVRTVQVSVYPLEPDVFFACKRVDIAGPEIEGGAGVVTESEAITYVYNLGDEVPPIGALLVATEVPFRWTMTYGNPRDT